MLIAIGPPGPLVVFLQVLCWIVLPALLLLVIITTLHHYARKRRNAANALAEHELAQFAEENANGEGAYLFFDHTGLVSDYRKKLFYSHARYSALKKDFDKLEQQYKKIETQQSIHPKNESMETTHGQGAIQNVPVPSETLFLKDLVEEKKAEVAFLQTQLEQRVRRQHEAEGEKENLRTALQAQLETKEEIIRSKEEQVAYAEIQLSELKQQNELLNAAVADGNDKVSLLSSQLEDERSRVVAAEEKLQTNKQLLQRLYKEFTVCLEQDEASPVIAMQPAYLNNAAEH